MSILRYDGAYTQAWWAARLAKPTSWELFVALPEVSGLTPAAKAEIWAALIEEVQHATDRERQKD
jgi:hypothetical protein